MYWQAVFWVIYSGLQERYDAIMIVPEITACWHSPRVHFKCSVDIIWWVDLSRKAVVMMLAVLICVWHNFAIYDWNAWFYIVSIGIDMDREFYEFQLE